MNVTFTSKGWAGYLHWADTDAIVLHRINKLVEEVRRTPFVGLGKPEPLRSELSGYWSRRITAEHRLVYRALGRAGSDQRLEILQCRYHY